VVLSLNGQDSHLKWQERQIAKTIIGQYYLVWKAKVGLTLYRKSAKKTNKNLAKTQEKAGKLTSHRPTFSFCAFQLSLSDILGNI
jgi:hypothetical protein